MAEKESQVAAPDASFQRVLVPLDGSATAEAVLPFMRRLARPADTTVILLEVVSPAPGSGASRSAPSRSRCCDRRRCRSSSSE